MICGGRKLLKRSVSSPAPPSFKNFETWGIFLFLHSALKKNKIKSHSFSGGETPPLRFKRIFYCRGVVLPPAFIVYCKTIFERTMCAKTLPSVKFFGVTFFSKKVTKHYATVERTMCAKAFPSGKFFAELFFKKAT